MSKYLYTERGFVKPERDQPNTMNYCGGPSNENYRYDLCGYGHYINSLPAVPAADPSKFIVGNWYEEGKDFMIDKDYILPSGDGLQIAVKLPYTKDEEPSQGLSEEGKPSLNPLERILASEENKPPLRLKQYGVNDLSPVSETPVFTERMKWFAQQLKDHNVPEHIADAMMNPIHGNQAGSDAYINAMKELEWKEIRNEAEKLYGDDPNNFGGQRDGYVNGVVAERSRNINLAAQLLRAKQRIKELEEMLSLYQIDPDENWQDRLHNSF